MPENDADSDGEYRPTDWLARSGASFGVGAYEDNALASCLRYEGPWDDDRDEPVNVVLWELYADSWQSHGWNGPERGAEQVSFVEYEIPVEKANRAHELASDLSVALSRAKDEGEIVQEEGKPDLDT